MKITHGSQSTPVTIKKSTNVTSSHTAKAVDQAGKIDQIQPVHAIDPIIGGAQDVLNQASSSDDEQDNDSKEVNHAKVQACKEAIRKNQIEVDLDALSTVMRSYFKR